jgi:hypothetical protein
MGLEYLQMIDDEIDNMELDELTAYIELLNLDEIALEEDNLVHDVAEEIEDIGESVKENVSEAPCNYVTA